MTEDIDGVAMQHLPEVTAGDLPRSALLMQQRRQRLQAAPPSAVESADLRLAYSSLDWEILRRSTTIPLFTGAPCHASAIHFRQLAFARGPL
jgi:hypothetical protein